MKLYLIGVIIILMGFSQAATLTVCPSRCDYASIQAAINAASAGDVIEIQSGFYNETITINKNITFRGIDTGGGLPTVANTFLCNHPGSILGDVRPFILFGGCPNENIHLYNNTFEGGKALSSSSNMTIIKPCMDFNGDPSYIIEIQANKSSVNPGDNLGIALFISGAGNVNCSKLRVSIPPYIVRNKNIKLMETNYTGRTPVIIVLREN